MPRLNPTESRQTSENNMQVSQLDVCTFLLTVFFLISVLLMLLLLLMMLLLLLVVINLRRISIDQSKFQSTESDDLRALDGRFPKNIDLRTKHNFENERDWPDRWKEGSPSAASRRATFALPNPSGTVGVLPLCRWSGCPMPASSK